MSTFPDLKISWQTLSPHYHLPTPSHSIKKRRPSRFKGCTYQPPKIHGSQRPPRKLRNQMRIQIRVLSRPSLYWILMKNLKKNCHGSIISRLTFKTGRTLSQLLLTNDVRYVAWLTSISLSGVRSSGEDSMVNFSDVSQTKKHRKL